MTIFRKILEIFQNHELLQILRVHPLAHELVKAHEQISGHLQQKDEDFHHQGWPPGGDLGGKSSLIYLSILTLV